MYKKEGEKKMDEKQAPQIRQDKTTGNDYECGKCCRLCPFPGLKCVIDQGTWKRIK
jgi:thiamine biosynthesis protein ThiC